MTNIFLKRIPSLDGLRAISILLVVFSHAFRSDIKIIDLGNLGVRFFFIISAYLIVSILLRDVEKNRFSIKTFYFKRVLRTFPAFYIYLIAIYFFLNYLGVFEWEQFWRAPIYLENYHPRNLWNEKQWFIGHAWSLAVEEQFYILVSLLFLFLNRKIISQKSILRILIFILIIVPLIRCSYLYFTAIPNVFRGSIHRSFETVADSIAIGGMLALIPFEKISKSKYVLFFKNKIWLLVIVICLFQILNSSVISATFGLIPRYIYNLFGLTTINCSLGLIMLLTILFPNSTPFSKLLNTRVMITIGLWSYSIYLWQQVWLYPWNLSIVLKLAGVLVCSITSYYLVEKPFLKLRDYLLNKRKNR